MKERNVEVKLTTPGRAKGNGLAEIANKFIGEKIRALHLEDPTMSLELMLYKVQFAWNITPNSTTGLSPFYLTYGQEARTILSKDAESSMWWNDYGAAIQKAEAKRLHVIQQRNERKNASTKPSYEFSAGDRILYWNDDQKTGVIGKLQIKWHEATVKSVKDNTLILTKGKGKGKPFVRNADQCKPFRAETVDSFSGEGGSIVRGHGLVI